MCSFNPVMEVKLLVIIISICENLMVFVEIIIVIVVIVVVPV